MKEDHILLKLWRIIYPGLIYLTISFGVGMGALILIMIMKRASLTSQVLTAEQINRFTEEVMTMYFKNTLLITILSSVITIPFLYFFFARDIKLQKKRGTYEKYVITDKRNIIFVVISAIFSCIGFNLLLELSHLGEIFKGFSELAQYMFDQNIWLEIIAMVVMAPIVEELLFRGLIYKRCQDYWGEKIAIVVSALIFGLYHMNVVQGIYAFCLGYVLAFMYMKFKNLWIPILFHGIANGISVLISECSYVTKFFELLSSELIYEILFTICMLGGLIVVLYKIHPKEFVKVTKVD